MPNRGRIETLTVNSQALRNNRLNDPHQRQLPVYLPPGYDDDPDRRYPTIILLPAHGRTGIYYLNWNQYSETMDARLDRLITSDQMPPVIVALPDFWTRFGGSQFVDSAVGHYATYLTEEIIPAVDKHFRTLPDRAHRAVMGHSSGGYGALYHAMHNPDLFGAVAARAPDAYFEYSSLPMLARFHQQVEKYGGLAAFIEQIPDIHPKKGSFWEAIHTAMYSMAYGTNPDAPLGFDPPIDLETGALVPAVWERWLAFDPVRMIEKPAHQDALRSMQAIFLEVGQFDEYQLHVGARLLHRRLEALDIAHRYEEFPDGHSSTSYRYDVALPVVAQAISG